jgi:hypothetical protein
MFTADSNQQQQQSKQLPILASRELLSSDNKSNNKSNTNNNENKRVRSTTTSAGSETSLFRDYVLIPSKTKFKHLIHTVFEKIHLANKQNYSVIDGKYIYIFFHFSNQNQS